MGYKLSQFSVLSPLVVNLINYFSKSFFNLYKYSINTNNNSYFTTYLQDTCVCVCWAQIVTSSEPGVGLMMRDEMR